MKYAQHKNCDAVGQHQDCGRGNMRKLAVLIILMVSLIIIFTQASCSSGSQASSTTATASTQPQANNANTTQWAVPTTTSRAAGATNKDPWIVSQKAEPSELSCKGCRACNATNEQLDLPQKEYCYLFTVTVKKDKPSSYIAFYLENTDVDGDWKDNPQIRNDYELSDTIQENPDGTVTYQHIISFNQATDYRVRNESNPNGKPYNAKYHYQYLLIHKDDTYLSSSKFCFPDLPC